MYLNIIVMCVLCHIQMIPAQEVYSRTDEGLTDIPSDISPSVISITLDRNDIFVIPPGAFSSFQFLTELNLNFCGIRTIAQDAFAGTPIINLAIKGNDMTNASEFISLFSIKNTLSELRLTGNPVELFSDREQWAVIFNSLGALTKLWIKSVGLEDCLDLGDAADGVRVLGLEDNSISNLRKECWSGFNNLRLLSLSENQLTSIPDFSLLPANNNLQGLFLDYNNIITMDVSQLMMLGRLEELDLSYNNLSSIPDMTSLPVTTLTLIGNPLFCDSGLVWIKQTGTGSLNVIMDGAPCIGPSNLVDIPWNNIGLADLQPVSGEV